MTLLQAIILAVVQGATEFLPVSSSGHLVLTKKLLGIETVGGLWVIALHFGTLLAVLFVFRRELWHAITGFFVGMARLKRGNGYRATWASLPDFRMGFYIILGTVPAVGAALLFRTHIQHLFSNAVLSTVMIFLTGQILWWSRPHSQVRTRGRIQLSDSFWIGCAQAVAILPGISRSGITISAGLARGVAPNTAAKFSFLLSVPAILGGVILKVPDLGAMPSEQIIPLVTGTVASAATGYIALRVLLRMIERGRLHLFAYYCWAVGIVGGTILWARM